MITRFIKIKTVYKNVNSFLFVKIYLQVEIQMI